MISEKIFKAYDIRGVYPTELNEKTAYVIGRAFARACNAISTVVGSDMRLSGPQLKAELIRGITDEGVDVIDIGLVSIDTVYAAVGVFGYESGIMITASHNPKEYNGFKMVAKGMHWIRGIDIKDKVMNLPKSLPEKKGTVTVENILPRFINHVLSFVNLGKIKPFKVVVDAGNGMAGKIVPLLAEHLPIQIIPLNFELDGNFPAHPSNPLLPESQVQIKEVILKEKADFGVIFDGDTDRLFFIDEHGTFIRADITLLLLAKLFLEREPGKGVAYNLICSKIVPEMIYKWGGKPIRTIVGFVNVSNGLKENNGIVGGELSAHYCFRDNAYADSGFIAWLILLELLSKDGRPLSAIVMPFYKYVKNPELNITVDDPEEKLVKVKEAFYDGKQDLSDGVTVEYDNWWFNVRPSNTEPLLRITVEAETEEMLEEKTEQILKVINT